MTPRGTNDAAQPAAYPGETWELRLYVTGRTPTCVRALANLQRACAHWLPGRYHIEIIDLVENPHLGPRLLAAASAQDVSLQAALGRGVPPPGACLAASPFPGSWLPVVGGIASPSASGLHRTQPRSPASMFPAWQPAKDRGADSVREGAVTM
jgi:KaiB domain